MHIYNGEFIAQFPLIPGHEFCGEVVEVGKDVTDIKTGDKVVVDNPIFGVGPVGLLASQVIKSYGVGKVVVCDINNY